MPRVLTVLPWVISTGTATSISPRPRPMTTRSRGTRTRLNVVHQEAGSVMEPFVRAILVTIWSHPSVHVNYARLVVTVIKPTKADASKIVPPVRFRLKWVSLPLHNAKDGARPVPFLPKSVKQHKPHAKVDAQPVRSLPKWVWMPVHNVNDAPPVHSLPKLVKQKVTRVKIAPLIFTILKKVGVRAQFAQQVGTPSFQNQLLAVTFTTTPDALKANFQPTNPQYH